jgi:hypothetical protein
MDFPDCSRSQKGRHGAGAGAQTGRLDEGCWVYEHSTKNTTYTGRGMAKGQEAGNYVPSSRRNVVDFANLGLLERDWCSGLSSVYRGSGGYIVAYPHQCLGMEA